MTDRTQPDALRLAEELEHDPGINRPSVVAELRRLHDENTTLQQGYDAARMEIAHLNKQLVKEAARTAEEKLLADQMTLQHAHQATLHREAQERIQELVRQRDAAQEVAAMNAKSGASWAARVQELEAQLEAIGAGGVEPLRSRCLHQIAEPAVSSQQENSREDASYASLSLAEMVLSDCGHSSNYTPLLERVAGRIDRHVERLLTAQQADRAMRAPAAPAAVAATLTKLQRKAIAVCFASDKVSVSEVQRKLSISYADAQTLCQSVVDLGLADELELAPSLKRGAPAPQPAPAAQGDAEDAARYRWLVAHCRSTAEHWRGRWAIVVEGPAPELENGEYLIDEAIDAARAKAKEGVSHG